MALKLTPEQEQLFKDQITWQGKHLWEHILPIDLVDLEDKFIGTGIRKAWNTGVKKRHILDLQTPINCLNWVIENTKYVSDLEQHNKVEHWPRPEGVLETMADDCDGLAILISSILWSLGAYHVHLTVGRYKQPDEPSSIYLPANHAWVVIYKQEDWDTFLESYNPYTGFILEGTGDQPYSRLPNTLELSKFYDPYWSGLRAPLSMRGATYAHGPWEDHLLKKEI